MDENDFSKQLEELQKKIDDLKAERDSLTDENNSLNDKILALSNDLNETKKLNFTLGRQISRAQEDSDIDIMNKLFR